jgi:WD40 repeat protein
MGPCPAAVSQTAFMTPGTSQNFLCWAAWKQRVRVPCQIVLGRYFWPGVITGMFLLSLVCVLTLTQPSKPDRAITYVAVSHSGRWLAAGTGSGVIMICDRDKFGSCRTVTGEGGVLNDLRFSPDDRFLAIANEGIQFLAIDQSEHSFALRSDRRNYGTVRFNNTGTELLTITGQSEIQVLNLPSRATVSTICCSSVYGEVAFSPDGALIFNAGHWPRVWDKYGHLLRCLTADRQYPTFGPIAIDRERRFIFMGSQDGRVYVWDLQHYNLLTRSDPHDEYVHTIAIVPKTDREIAYAGFGTVVRLWNPETGKESELPDLRPTSNIIVLTDGYSLLFGTSRGTIEVWNIRGTPRRTTTVATIENRK